jgi:hypothetical protein
MRKQKVLIVLTLILITILNTQPAYAQKTTQRASASQVVVMVVFSAVAMTLLRYLRIP